MCFSFRNIYILTVLRSVALFWSLVGLFKHKMLKMVDMYSVGYMQLSKLSMQSGF